MRVAAPEAFADVMRAKFLRDLIAEPSPSATAASSSRERGPQTLITARAAVTSSSRTLPSAGRWLRIQ